MKKLFLILASLLIISQVSAYMGGGSVYIVPTMELDKIKDNGDSISTSKLFSIFSSEQTVILPKEYFSLRQIVFFSKINSRDVAIEIIKDKLNTPIPNFKHYEKITIKSTVEPSIFEYIEPSFIVPKEWLLENNIEVSDLEVWNNDNGIWKPVRVVDIEEFINDVNVNARTSRFGELAVGFRTAEPIVVNTEVNREYEPTSIPKPEVEPPQPEVEIEEPEKTQSNILITIIIGIIVVVVIGSLYYINKIKKKKKEK